MALKHSQEYALQVVAAQATAEAKAETERNFTAYIFHEVRNPLNGIRGLVDILVASTEQYVDSLPAGAEPLGSDFNPADIAPPGRSMNGVARANGPGGVTQGTDSQLLELTKLLRWASVSINDCSNHVVELLDRAMDLSMLESGELLLQSEPINLQDLGTQVVHQMSGLCKEEVVLELITNAPHVWILGDALRWKQLLINLVGNALKATQAGKVSLNLQLLQQRNSTSAQAGLGILGFDHHQSPPAGFLSVRVTDSGPGIPLGEIRDNLFNKYTANSKNGFTRGAGLGLAVAQMIAKLMETTIQVRWEGTWEHWSSILAILSRYPACLLAPDPSCPRPRSPEADVVVHSMLLCSCAHACVACASTPKSANLNVVPLPSLQGGKPCLLPGEY